MTSARILPFRPKRCPRIGVGEDAPVDIVEFSSLCSVSQPDLLELVSYGVLSPVDIDALPWMFSTRGVAVSRRAGLLRKELDLDGHGFALAMMLLGRLAEVEARLRMTRVTLRHDVQELA